MNALDAEIGFLFAGGEFRTLSFAAGVGDNVGRDFIVSFNISDGTVHTWYPLILANAANNSVLEIEATNMQVYFSGIFDTVDGESRLGNAASVIQDETLSSWTVQPAIETPSLAIRADNGRLFLGGAFGAVEVDPNTGTLLAWDAGANDIVYDIQTTATDVFLGGSFKSVNATPRKGLAAISLNDGSILPWDAVLEATVGTPEVLDIDIDGTTLYFVGTFSSVNGTSRTNLAAVRTDDATVESWNPTATGAVLAVAANGTDVFLGGKLYST